MRTADPIGRLRASGLLDDAQLERLAASWTGRFADLVAAGLLTRYQARMVARGRVSRLRLGPYLLLERLGSGGGGVVYKAHHTLLDRTVALKVLRRPGREAAVTAGLSHPNIVAAYDARTVRGRVVVALEYVEGVDLQRLLDEGGPLPVPLACEVVRQTCRALEYLRGRGLVHRDVKPANLVLVPDAGAPQVKLIDMGLTCGPGDDELCGTADYLAPERGHGDPADVRGDLYSLGCTFYHLLTGSVPYPGGGGPGKLLRHRLEEPRPVEQMRPGVPAHLVALIGRMMERDPELRLADPNEVIERLEPPPEPVAMTPPRRLRWLTAALVGLTLGAAGRAIDRDAPPPVRVNLDELIATQDVVTLAGRGPFRMKPVTLNRPLVIRSADGAVIERAAGEAWEPLFTTASALTLEGITLRDGHPPPLISVRRGPELTLRRCTLIAGRQAISVEAGGSCRVTLDGCDVSVAAAGGAALSVWTAEPGPGRVDVTILGGQVTAGRGVACRSLDGPVMVNDVGCRWSLRGERASFDGYRGPADGVLRWGE